MDLVSIFRAVWGHKLVTIPVILFTCLSAFYVVAVKAPVYQASSSFALVYPPAAPTQAQIAANPKLGQVSTFNPLVAYGDPAAVTQILINLLSTPSSQKALANAGAGTQYQIAPSAGSAFIVDITGVGTTAQGAVRSANVVTQATEHALYHVQANQGVNRGYMITTYQLSTPNQAGQKLSTKLRPLLAVVGFGVLLLFIAISIAQAVGRRHTESSIGNGTAPKAPRFDQTEPMPVAALARYGLKSNQRGQVARKT